MCCQSARVAGLNHPQYEDFPSVDFELAIDHRQRNFAHFRCTGCAKSSWLRRGRSFFELGTLQISRHHLALDEWMKCGRVADLTAKLDASDRGPQIFRVT